MTSDMPMPRKLAELTAFSLFRLGFDIELAKHEIDLLFEWGSVAIPIFLGMGSAAGGAKAHDISEKIASILLDSDFGNHFLNEAAKNGMDGQTRLREAIFIFIFASWGVPVGTNTVV